MITVNDSLILNTDIETVLEVLKQDLYNKGLSYFSKIKSVNNYVMTNCPNHKDGQERNPSCGVYKDTGFFHCFTCGYVASLPSTISKLFGESGEAYGIQYLKDKFQTYNSQNRTVILPVERHKSIQQIYITDSELSNYRYYHPYMWQRKLTPEIVQFFEVGYDIATNCLTFPVRDMYGNCVFVARRSVSTKFFNYPTNVSKPVYALDKILKYNIKEVWVCESFINCINCWQYNKPAVALMGTGSKEQYNILKASGIRKYTLAFDGDSAGRNGAEKFIKEMGNYALIDIVNIPAGKDINDLTEREFLNLKTYKVNY